MKKQLNQNDRREILKTIEARSEIERKKLTAADPGWTQRVDTAERKIAIGQLKIEKDLQELEKVQGRIQELSAQRDTIQARINSKMPTEKNRRGYCSKKSVCEAIDEIVAQVHESVMVKDKTGKRIKELDELVQTKIEQVLVATTIQEIIDGKVTEWNN